MFRIGDRVTWQNRRGRRFTGTVVEVVPRNTHPLALGWHWQEKARPYVVKFEFERFITWPQQSYLVTVQTKGKPQLWWPRVNTLQPYVEETGLI